MYPHQAERLTEILDRHGLEALVASREANVAYVTGFRGVSHTVFEAPQYAVFTRRGTGLVVPAVEIASIVADGIEGDQIACFGDVVATYDERAEPNVKRIRDLSESRVPDAVEALGRRLDAHGVRAGTCARARSFASTWAESSMGIRQRSRAPRWRLPPTRVWTRRIGPCRPDSTLHSTRSSLACPGHALTPRRSRRRARRGSRASRSATSVMRSASKRTSLRSWLMTSTRR